MLRTPRVQRAGDTRFGFARSLPGRHLAGLLGVAATGCFATLLGAGKLAGIPAYETAGVAAAVVAVVAFAVTGTSRRRHEATVAADGAPVPASNLKTTKRILALTMLAGIAVYVGGGGVFGSFSAETANPGSTAASGTLTMSDQVNTGTACVSNDLVNGTNNVNPNCATVLTLSNLAPGVFTATETANVTVQNTGSIDASKLWLWAPPNSTTLSSGLTSGSPVASLAVAALPAAVSSGQSIVVSSGANTQTFNASAGASLGATSITVTSQNANFSYPIGSAVNVVDCRDAKTTVAGITGATKGTDLNFNPTAGNPLCGVSILYVQETTGTTSGSPGNHNYCWLGASYGVVTLGTTTGSLSAGTLSSAAIAITASSDYAPSGGTITITDGVNSDTLTLDSAVGTGAVSVTASGTLSHSYSSGASVKYSSGMCKAPISVNLSSGLSTAGAITSLPVNALDGNVHSGDSIAVTSGTNTQTFTATANAYIGATSIAVSSATPNFAYPTTSTVTDTTTLGTLNSDTTDTLTRFDTLHNGAQGPIELKTVTSNGQLQASGPTTELAAGAASARTFLIGVYFPQPAGNNQNALQGLSSTFGMTWHIDQ